MHQVVSDLVGEMVELLEFDSPIVIVRGRVRAVTSREDGTLCLWVEELSEAERQAVFDYRTGPFRDERAGDVVCAAAFHTVRIRICRPPSDPAIASSTIGE